MLGDSRVGFQVGPARLDSSQIRVREPNGFLTWPSGLPVQFRCVCQYHRGKQVSPPSFLEVSPFRR